MKSTAAKPAARQNPRAASPLQHPHYFEQLNDNLKMRYLTLKQRVNSNAEMPLDQKKKALDQSSRGYLELRELTKQLQYVCLKESVDESFTQGYQAVITCQQLSLTRIKQLLLSIKGSLEEQSSFFHIICKEMQRRQQSMRRMLGYLRKYQELADLQTTAFEEPVGQGMPILYDLMSKIVDRLIEYRQTTLCLLERLADWKSHLYSVMTGEDEDDKQKILKGIAFQYNRSNILQVLATETTRLTETPLCKFIPFREDCETDPLLLHPYKLSALNDDLPLNRPPLLALFTLNRKYVQRLTRSEQFFLKQLGDHRNRTSYPEELPEYKVYSQIFSEKFYKKAVKRNHIKAPEPSSFVHKRFDTDVEDDMLLPLIKSEPSSDSQHKYQTSKGPATTLDTEKLENPKPRGRSRIRLKPVLPTFKRYPTEAEQLDKELKAVISNYIRQKTMTQNMANTQESYSSQRKLLQPASQLKKERSRQKKLISMSGGVVSLSIGVKQPDNPPQTSFSVANLEQKVDKPSPTKKVLSLYKYEIISYSPQSRRTLPPIQKQEEHQDPLALNLINEEVQTQQSADSLNVLDNIQANLQFKDDNKHNASQQPQVSLDTINPVLNLPEPQSENLDSIEELQLSQVLLHDWQFQQYIENCKKKYFYSVLEPTLTWESYYIYELKKKTDEEPAAVIIFRRNRSTLKNYHVLTLVMLSSGSEELIGVALTKCKQKLLSYNSETPVVVQVSRHKLQSWMVKFLEEALFEADVENYVATIKKPNSKQQQAHKTMIQLQISGIMIKDGSPIRPNFSSEDVEPFSPKNFFGDGIQACLQGENIRSSKQNMLEFKKSSGRELYLSQTVHSRKCKSLREINNFLEAYELEVFEGPELGGASKVNTEVVVCAVSENLSLPFGYATIPAARSVDGTLNYFIFNCANPSVDLWTRDGATGLEQMCMIKLQRNMWMYLYKSDNDQELSHLPIYESKFRQIGRRHERQYSKCLIEMFVRQLYGKMYMQQLNSEGVYGSLFLSMDEDDITYNSIDYNLTHKDMLYFYLPFVVGFCVDGDGQRHSLCEVVVEAEAIPQNAS